MFVAVISNYAPDASHELSPDTVPILATPPIAFPRTIPARNRIKIAWDRRRRRVLTGKFTAIDGGIAANDREQLAASISSRLVPRKRTLQRTSNNVAEVPLADSCAATKSGVAPSACSRSWCSMLPELSE